MAGYRDYMSVESPHAKDESWIKRAIRAMANAANKRLKRMEQRGLIYYMGEEENLGKEGYTAGYKRFGIKGMDRQQLQNEFKRVRGFLLNPISSLTGLQKEMKKSKSTYSSFDRKLTRREQKDYNRMIKEKETRGISTRASTNPYDMWQELHNFTLGIRIYLKLVEKGVYNPTPVDSDRVRDIVDSVVESNWAYKSFDELYDIAKERVEEYLESRDDRRGTYSTSDFFYGRWNK